jgi:UDP:flavonoid glycosyltransferase YjiC (YdhE family)
MACLIKFILTIEQFSEIIYGIYINESVNVNPMRFLLFPGSNSLSHVAKSLGVRDILLHKGHEVLIATIIRHSSFLRKCCIPHEIIPDIQESDNASFPTIFWFKKPERIIECIRAEEKLINQYKPDRVLGIFRFTTKMAARIACVSYFSLICGCMLPESKDVLGFMENEAGIEKQKENLDYFNRYMTEKFNKALQELGLEGLSNIKQVFKGERTFLWDFREFLPLLLPNDVTYVGPVQWDNWPEGDLDISSFIKKNSRLAVVSFGTCTNGGSSCGRITNILADLGFRVLQVGGGDNARSGFFSKSRNITVTSYVPLNRILPHARILISHGGQLTLFEAIQHLLPSLVMPFQPEQAHNGVCMERIQCGKRLVTPQVFRGNSQVYIDALNKMSDEEIRSKIRSVMDNNSISNQLKKMADIVNGYRGAEQVAMMLEGE